MLQISKSISIRESNTVVSAYTMYRHLQQYCSHPSLSSIDIDSFDCCLGKGSMDMVLLCLVSERCKLSEEGH